MVLSLVKILTPSLFNDDLISCSTKYSSPSSSSSSSSSSEAPVITGIAAEDPSVKGIELAVGEEGGIGVKVEGTGDFNKAINWSVADATIASVSNTGLLKGLKIGKTKLTAAAAGDPSQSLEFDVEVVAASAVITCNVTDVELEPDKEEELKVSVKTRGEIANTIEFSSSNEAVAEVDENGKTFDIATIIDKIVQLICLITFFIFTPFFIYKVSFLYTLLSIMI